MTVVLKVLCESVTFCVLLLTGFHSVAHDRLVHQDSRVLNMGAEGNSSTSHTRHPRDMSEFVCGWGAAFINITITFPINKVMFRQMLHGVHSHHAIRQLLTEGWKHLYRGLLPPLLQKTISVSIMFGTYDEYQRIICHFFPAVNPTICWSTAAMLAGTTEAILMPFERVQTLLQTTHYHSRFQNTIHAFRALGPEYGFREYYRGLSAILLRNGPSNVLFFGLRGPIKETVMPLVPNDTFLGHFVLDFFSGAILGAGISTVFYPLNVVKTRMQVKCGGKFESMRSVVKTIYNERGKMTKGLFIGIHVNYTRALLSWGIINASYELLKKVFYSTS